MKLERKKETGFPRLFRTLKEDHPRIVINWVFQVLELENVDGHRKIEAGKNVNDTGAITLKR